MSRAVVLMLGLACMIAGPAHAEDEAHAAEREYRLGFKALDAGDAADALDHYQRSYELKARPRTLFNIATCQEQLGRDLDAWRNYHAFLDVAEARDATVVDRAHERIEALRATLRGEIVVDSSPSGAEVRVDGARASRGVTPLTLSLAPGTHVVRISMPEVASAERAVEISPETTTSVTIPLTLPAAITITAEPDDAVIEADDGGDAVTGTLEAAVSPGRHSFTVRRKGYQTEQIVVEAVAGRTYEQRVSLRPDPAAATLVIEGLRDATVAVDGLTPDAPVNDAGLLAMRDVAAGAHELTVARAGRKPWRDSLHLSPGETVTVTVDLALRRSPARTALAWGSATLGVASLAGGTVLGVLALRSVTSDAAGDHDRGKTTALFADGLFVLGAATIVAAWRLFRTGSSSARIRRTHRDRQ